MERQIQLSREVAPEKLELVMGQEYDIIGTELGYILEYMRFVKPWQIFNTVHYGLARMENENKVWVFPLNGNNILMVYRNEIFSSLEPMGALSYTRGLEEFDRYERLLKQFGGQN